MSIIRVVKNKNYTTINNTCLRDETLSWRSKGIFAYIMSLPDDWKLHRSEVMTHGTEGRQAFDTAFKELQAAGYIKKEPDRKEDGTLRGWVYTVYEVPEGTPTDLPETRNSVNRCDGISDLLSTEGESTEETDLLSVDQSPEEGEVKVRVREEIRKTSIEAAALWAKLAKIPLREADSDLFEKFLLDNIEDVPPYHLLQVMNNYHQILEYPELGWKTKYKSLRSFLSNFSRIEDFIFNKLPDLRRLQDNDYSMIRNGIIADVETTKHRAVKGGIELLGPGYVEDPKTHWLSDRPYLIGLLCVESDLTHLPDECLELPDKQYLERSLKEIGYEERLNLMNKVLKERS